MKKIIRTAGILTLVFAASVAVYFFAARKNMQKEGAVYSSMNAPEFPVVYIEFDGKDINALHGYIQNMSNQAVGDTISVLPEDRKLAIRVKEYGNGIAGLSYEVRNLSMDRLIEKTEVEDWQAEGEDIRAVLPIQNLLTQNETYLLDITIPELCGQTAIMQETCCGWQKILQERVWIMIRQEIWYLIWKQIPQRTTVPLEM